MLSEFFPFFVGLDHGFLWLGGSLFLDLDLLLGVGIGIVAGGLQQGEPRDAGHGEGSDGALHRGNKVT